MGQGRATVTVLFVAAALLGGCRKATPKQTVLNAARAIEKADGEALAKCFDASEDEKAFLKAAAEPMSRIMAFETAGLEAYGPEAWHAAKGGKETKGGFPTVEEMERDLQTHVKGGWATCTVRGRKMTLELTRRGGEWLLRAGGLVPPRQQRDNALALIRAGARIADRVKPSIGKEGMTPEKVNQEVGRAVAAEALRMLGEALKQRTGAARPPAAKTP